MARQAGKEAHSKHSPITYNKLLGWTVKVRVCDKQGCGGEICLFHLELLSAMFKTSLLFCAILVVCSGFDSGGFVKKFCKKNDKDVLVCESVQFTEDQLKKIQVQNFIISEEKNISFVNSFIGVLNENFLKCFPYCIDLTLKNVTFFFDNSETHGHHPLLSLNINESTVRGNKNGSLLKNLQNLHHFGLINSALEYRIFDKNFLGNNPSIKSLDINNGNIEKVEDDAFAGLGNVEYIDFADFDVLSFKPNLFKNKDNLKFLKLRGNHLEKVPKYNLPKLEELQLHVNKIEKISKTDFETYKTLKKLDLGKNGIKTLDVDVFYDLEHLEELCLAGNEISQITQENFKNLKHLKKVNLSENKIKETDLKDMKIEVNLFNQRD
ncbi:Con family protein [Megaselia abdita]